MGTLEKLVRFVCACAPGIAIGLWSAGRFGFWRPFGAVVGAMVSYLLVEWKVVAYAIREALKQTISWQPDKELWRQRGWNVLAFLSITLSCAVALLGIIWLDSYTGHSGFFSKPITTIQKTFEFYIIVGVFSIVVSVFFVACLWLFASQLFLKKSLLDLSDNRWDIKDQSKDLIKFCNPGAVFFYWPVMRLWNLPKAVAWFFREVFPFFTSFAMTVFFIIHSRKRTLCATTTFITVVVGYTVNGDLITFTVAGAVIGALYSVSSLKDWVIAKVQSQSQPVSA